MRENSFEVSGSSTEFQFGLPPFLSNSHGVDDYIQDISHPSNANIFRNALSYIVKVN